MAEWVDLLDSANQKFDGSGVGMTSDNAQAGIIEAYQNTGGGGDLSNAEFPDSAHFANETAAVSAVNFDSSNKQRIAGSAGNITLAAPGIGSYLLLINDSSTITGIADSGAGTVTWAGPVPQWAASKLGVIACYYDGTNWTLNGSVEE